MHSNRILCAFYAFAGSALYGMNMTQAPVVSMWIIPHPDTARYKDIRMELPVIVKATPEEYRRELFPNACVMSVDINITLDPSANLPQPKKQVVEQAAIHLLLRIHNNPVCRREVLQALLENPATNPNLVDSLGYTPFRLATESQDQELIGLIVKHPRYRAGSADPMENTSIQNQNPMPVSGQINMDNPQNNHPPAHDIPTVQATEENQVPTNPSLHSTSIPDRKNVSHPTVIYTGRVRYISYLVVGLLISCALYGIVSSWTYASDYTQQGELDEQNNAHESTEQTVVE